jgi:hypothetical protein
MDALGNLLMFVSLIAFLVGAVTIAWPCRSAGFLSKRFDGVLAVIASIALSVLAQQVSPQMKAEAVRQQAESARQQAATAQQAASRPAPERYVSKSEALTNMRIGGFSWKTDGFGTVMVATFVIYNNNAFPVKDAVVTCFHSTNSGTAIDRNTRTVYERIEANGYQSVVEMNMGFIHSASTKSSCRVTDFTRV